MKAAVAMQHQQFIPHRLFVFGFQRIYRVHVHGPYQPPDPKNCSNIEGLLAMAVDSYISREYDTGRDPVSTTMKRPESDSLALGLALGSLYDPGMLQKALFHEGIIEGNF
jgi:hypothetical protein